MALRVLLADESTTIKKVIQLALQDFGVDVKAVHIGVDVLEVARSFQPEIVFADVLLQKRNGYDVCFDLKNDAVLKSVPVVLMWSSFMEFDQDAAQRAQANDKLEKPFDVETLRAIVMSLVPKLQAQPLAQFIQFAPATKKNLEAGVAAEQAAQHPMPTAHSSPASPSEVAAPPTAPPTAAPMPKSPEPLSAPAPSERAWSMDSFDDIQNFAAHEASSAPAADDEADPWAQQDLSKFKLDLQPVASKIDDFEVKLASDHFVNNPHSQARHPQATTSLASDDTASADQFKIDDRLSRKADLENNDLEIDPPDLQRPYYEPLNDDDKPDPSGLGFTDMQIELGEDDVAATGLIQLEPDDEHHAITNDEVVTPIQPLDATIRPDQAAPSPKRDRSLERESVMTADMRSDLRADLEPIIREQSREIIVELVRRLVPELAAEIIREELAKLVAENDDDADAGGRA